MNRESKDRTNLLAVNLSLASNALLSVLKTSVGIVGHSPALLADGINSTSDVVYSAIVRAFMGLAGKPPDREHPFGHRQLETIAALVIGAFVITTGVVIFWNAVNHVYKLSIGESRFEGAKGVALWVALFTVILKIWLTLFTGRIGRRTGSIAVLALARDHRNDIFSISAAALGIYFGRAGYAWVDPTAAAVVALMILYTGYEIIRDASADLMNILPGESFYVQVRKLTEDIAGVDQVEEIHVHRIGLYLFIDVTIGVDGTLSVAEGDRIAGCVEDALWGNIEYIRRVSVHFHPSKH